MIGYYRTLLATCLVTVATTRESHACTTTDVTYRSAGLQLAGTLYHPGGSDRVAAMVLVHGSGRVDRESMRWLAKLLCEWGVAALAYDKRGVGHSEGPEDAWSHFRIDDLATDAAAGVRFLRTRGDIDASRLGLFGASQGGWVVPRAAQLDSGVAFMAQWSASVSTIAEDNVFERGARLRGEGFSEAEVDTVRSLHLLDNDVSRNGLGAVEFDRRWYAHQGSRWFRRVYAGERPMSADAPYRNWYRGVMDVDPVPALRQFSGPSLWLYGDPTLDRFTPVALSLERLAALQAAGLPIIVRSFAGADHNLRRADRTDAPFREPLREWLVTVTRR